MKKYIQRGFNIEWPEKIMDTWKRGENVPEWLSDRANVTIMSSDGIKNIETRETSSGGYEIIDSGKNVILVTNTPYEEISIPQNAKSVIITFATSPDNIEVVAGTLYGKIIPEGVWPVEYHA